MFLVRCGFMLRSFPASLAGSLEREVFGGQVGRGVSAGRVILW